MELLVKIPKEFEQHFKQDAFEDSLNRLCVDAHLLAGLYEQETAKMLIDVFKSAVPVPPHGRLIDADAAIEDICGEILERQMNGMKGTPFYIEDLRTMWQRLEDEELIPTIIPEEKERR